ncbi:DUF551 domain-containing protein [Franconibacter pulveris 1160]|nr:hypothetical protein GCM10011513_12430 [Franconibacter daqui]
MQWTPVKHRLPDVSEHILSYIVNTTEGVGVAKYNPRSGFCDPILIGGLNYYGLEVTHWMPMPPPPIQDKKTRLRGS